MVFVCFFHRFIFPLAYFVETEWLIDSDASRITIRIPMTPISEPVAMVTQARIQAPWDCCPPERSSTTGSYVGEEFERDTKCCRWVDPALDRRRVLIGRDRTQYDAIGRFGIAQNFVGERCSRALKQ